MLVPANFFCRKEPVHVYQASRSQSPLSLYLVSRHGFLAGTARAHHATRNNTCEKCGKRRATEVHHLTYLRVFNELPSDLMALCRQCHAEVHWRQPANDNQIQFSFDFPEAPETEPEEA